MIFIRVQDKITMNLIGADDNIVPVAEGNEFFELLTTVYPAYGIMRITE